MVQSRAFGFVLTACLLFGLFGRAGLLAEGQPRLVHDFFPGEFEGSAPVEQLTQLGQTLFFVAHDLGSGLAVWRTDGASSERVPLPPTPEYPFGVNFASIVGSLGDRMLWTVMPEATSGVYLLVASTEQGDGVILKTVHAEDPEAKVPATVGGRYYFQDCRPAGCSIESTDGTLAGTRPVEALARFQGPDQEIVTTFGDRWLVFRSGERLLAYDPAKEQIQTLLPTGARSLEVYPSGDPLYLLTRHGQSKLFASRLRAPRAVQLFASRYIGVAGWRDGRFYFVPETGRLWSTGGSRATTFPYSGLRADPYSLLADELGAVGATTFFPMPGYYWGGLLGVDETRHSVGELHHACSGKYPCLANWMSKVTVAAGLGFEVIFGYLWQSDGTPGGTNPHDVLTVANPATFQVLDDRLLLGARGPDGAEQLWETDGTPGGTRSLSDGTPDVPFRVQGPPSPFAGALFVSATRKPVGNQLWRVADGRATAVTDLEHLASGLDPYNGQILGDRIVLLGANSSGWKAVTEEGEVEELPVQYETCTEAGCPRRRVTAGRRLLFSPYGEQGVWSTDGTFAGTGPVSPRIAELESMGPWRDRALVLDIGGALWSTDGTDAGTLPVAQIPMPPGTEIRSVGPIVPMGDLGFLFRRVLGEDPGLAALEVWCTDGTATGTIQVASAPFPRESVPFVDPVVVDGRLFFKLFEVLWTSDGSAAGTRPLPDLFPEAVFSLTAGSETLYVSTGDINIGPRTLWAVDPETLQAGLLGAFRSVDAESGSVLDDTLLFAATDLDGTAGWWISEGTPAGTRPVASLPGRLSITGLVTAGGRRYFTACDAEHGCELWSTDRLGEDTRLIQDLWPGPTGSNPEILSATDAAILFAAAEPTAGRELWRLDL